MRPHRRCLPLFFLGNLSRLLRVCLLHGVVLVDIGGMGARAVGVVVRIEPDALLDRKNALLLACSHTRRPEDLVHLLEREALRLGDEPPDEETAEERERLNEPSSIDNRKYLSKRRYVLRRTRRCRSRYGRAW